MRKRERKRRENLTENVTDLVEAIRCYACQHFRAATRSRSQRERERENAREKLEKVKLRGVVKESMERWQHLGRWISSIDNVHINESGQILSAPHQFQHAPLLFKMTKLPLPNDENNLK